MLKRNTSVKLAPQRWQDNAGDGVFDMIMTFEERVFDLVVEGKFIHVSTGTGFWSRRLSSCYKRWHSLMEAKFVVCVQI
jgi:myosin-crossreactive antigen